MIFQIVRCFGCGPGGEAPHDHLVEEGKPSAFARTKRKRGFSSMTPERRKEIATMGGKAAQSTGRGHRFNSEEARSAGTKGGYAVSKDRSRMAEIGRKGGLSRQSNRKEEHETV